MNLMPHLVLWTALTLVVIGLAVYRKRVTRGEDGTIHVLESDQRYVPDQARLATRLDGIDKWGKLLTVIALLYGLAVAAIYIYTMFSSTEIRMG